MLHLCLRGMMTMVKPRNITKTYQVDKIAWTMGISAQNCTDNQLIDKYMMIWENEVPPQPVLSSV